MQVTWHETFIGMNKTLGHLMAMMPVEEPKQTKGAKGKPKGKDPAASPAQGKGKQKGAGAAGVKGGDGKGFNRARGSVYAGNVALAGLALNVYCGDLVVVDKATKGYEDGQIAKDENPGKQASGPGTAIMRPSSTSSTTWTRTRSTTRGLRRSSMSRRGVACGLRGHGLGLPLRARR